MTTQAKQVASTILLVVGFSASIAGLIVDAPEAIERLSVDLPAGVSKGDCIWIGFVALLTAFGLFFVWRPGSGNPGSQIADAISVINNVHENGLKLHNGSGVNSSKQSLYENWIEESEDRLSRWAGKEITRGFLDLKADRYSQIAIRKQLDYLRYVEKNIHVFLENITAHKPDLDEESVSNGGDEA